MKQFVNRERVQEIVGALHKELEAKQDLLWPGQQVRRIEMLDPVAVCEVYGIRYETFDNLSITFPFRGSKMPVEGLLDRQARKIAVAHGLSEAISRFTAMHEIGHWILHKQEIMHRDRAIEKSNPDDFKRPLLEREADYFAAAFLMPRNMLKHYFEIQFGVKTPVAFDENFAFWLSPNDPDTLLFAEEGSLAREFCFARCESFNMNNFYSLAKQFRVSDSAMAYRIKELGLVKWP